MNDDLVYQRLREIAWRRKLTDIEQAELHTWLAAHPDARVDWANEAALSELLARLPDVPVPSNFTARVLRAVERDAATSDRERAPRWVWTWRSLVPRAAVTVLVVVAGLFAYQRHALAQRVELAQSVATVADVRSLPSPQFLKDFDVIRRLLPTPPADKDLLALMQ
jgi:anti-sigma factor RsiW